MWYAYFVLISYVVDLQIAYLTHLYLLPTPQIFYMTKFYMTSIQVEVRSPLGVAWTDDQIKRRLAAEIHTYGNDGHVQAWSNSATP